MVQASVSGFLLGLALVFSVGPVIFNIIRLRLSQGFAGAFFFIAGVWVSDLLKNTDKSNLNKFEERNPSFFSYALNFDGDSCFQFSSRNFGVS